MVYFDSFGYEITNASPEFAAALSEFYNDICDYKNADVPLLLEACKACPDCAMGWIIQAYITFNFSIEAVKDISLPLQKANELEKSPREVAWVELLELMTQEAGSKVIDAAYDLSYQYPADLFAMKTGIRVSLKTGNAAGLAKFGALAAL